MGYWASPNNDLNSLYLHTSSDNQVSNNQVSNNQASPGLANIVRSSFLVLNTNFLCNRKMNAYLKQELYLGIEYLNAVKKQITCYSEYSFFNFYFYYRAFTCIKIQWQ